MWISATILQFWDVSSQSKIAFNVLGSAYYWIFLDYSNKFNIRLLCSLNKEDQSNLQACHMCCTKTELQYDITAYKNVFIDFVILGCFES